MNYLKFTPYVYLAAGLYFLYDAISKLDDPEQSYWLSFLIGGLAIFMFFFRMRFAKKFENRNKR